ncbi:MAG: glycosyltransferase family 4 protein, partial [Candidatus Thorarchaeota archaeon]
VLDLRVAIISMAYPGIRRGFCPGIERVSEGMADGLASKGVDVTVLTSRRMPGPDKEIRPSGVEVRRLRSLIQYPGFGFMATGLVDFSFSVYRNQIKELRNYDTIQIVSQSFIPTRVLGNRPKIFSYFPHLDIPESFLEYLYLPAVNHLAKMIFNRSDAVVAGIPKGSVEVDVLQKTLGVPSDKIRFVHEGFDPSKFKERMPDPLLMNQFGDDIVLFVGPLVKRKGIEYLIRAMKLVLQKKPTSHLLLVGSVHSYGRKMIDLVHKLELSKNVHFLGFVSEESLSKYYSAAKVFAFPSLLEGYPLVVLEAMGSGTPVVSTNLSPIVEQLGDTGIIIKPGDVQALAQGISNLLQDDHKRGLLGKSTRERALNNFTWSNMADELINIYNEFI